MFRAGRGRFEDWRAEARGEEASREERLGGAEWTGKRSTSKGASAAMLTLIPGEKEEVVEPGGGRTLLRWERSEKDPLECLRTKVKASWERRAGRRIE